MRNIKTQVPGTFTFTATVLDVRVPEEREERPLAAGELIEIEVGEVRDRAGEIPEGPIVVACAHGTRSAEVVRWLGHRGTRARYLGGRSRKLVRSAGWAYLGLRR